jgi:hypothetical protein
MTLSPKILAIIQKAGTAVFTAEAALKDAVADSAKKVADSVTKNPHGEQHDSLYQDWKNVARISKAISAIEAELKSIYALAAVTPVSKGNAIALPAPAVKADLEVLTAIDITDVVEKRAVKKPKAAKKSAKRTGARAKRSGGEDNSAKVLAHLQTVLNDQSFTKLNQSAVAIAIGLPKGSIGASIKKLVQGGKLVQGEAKEFKLATAA